MSLLHHLIARRNRKLSARYEQLRREVRASLAREGGRAAQRKRMEPVRAKCRQLCAEMDRDVPEVLA